MNKPDVASNAASLAQHLESLLGENHFCFSRRATECAHRAVFDIVCDTNEKEWAEQRITAYVYDRLICFEAAVTMPAACTDKDAAAALVNDLNLFYSAGTFQLNLQSGEMNWTNYVAVGSSAWPGDDVVLFMLESSKEMARILYRKLFSANNCV